MNLEDFKVRYQKARQERPKVFEYMQIDPPASDVELDAVEEIMGCTFENSHRAFLKEFGGGEFGLGLLFSANEQSEWYVPSQVSNQSLPADRFFPVSDNFAGDIYGFEVINGRCVAPLKVYDHETSELKDTEFADVYEFMDRYALRPA